MAAFLHEQGHQALVGGAEPCLDRQQPGRAKRGVAHGAGQVATANPGDDLGHVEREAGFVRTAVEFAEDPAPEPLRELPSDGVVLELLAEDRADGRERYQLSRVRKRLRVEDLLPGKEPGGELEPVLDRVGILSILIEAQLENVAPLARDGQLGPLDRQLVARQQGDGGQERRGVEVPRGRRVRKCGSFVGPSRGAG